MTQTLTQEEKKIFKKNHFLDIIKNKKEVRIVPQPGVPAYATLPSPPSIKTAAPKSAIFAIPSAVSKIF